VTQAPALDFEPGFIEYIRTIFDSMTSPYLQDKQERDSWVPAGEVQIVWNEDARPYHFCRAAVIPSKYRRGMPKHWCSGVALGFSNLGPGAPSQGGYYLRRVFYLDGIDLTAGGSPYGLAHTNRPRLDAVRISTIKPGVWGEL